MAAANPNKKELFYAALEIPPGQERIHFLEQRCGTDLALRQEIQSLLDAHDEPAQCVKRIDELPPTANAVGDSADHEDQIGPYKLLQKIGEGGMGIVYMADQLKPVKRRVAVKVIKPGMDSKEVIARFEAERQALALMDHPNIAKVLDAGTTSEGRPYFVMELVKGVPVTQFCDERHLGIVDRLQFFAEICQAVHHAHQKGIIHRDLKPTNVLIASYDGKFVPKVIDFGVAKAIAGRLTEKTMFTRFGQIVGTFDYMSPEQAEFNQLDVDIRSDVYSLGVVLYELLSGHTPFDRQRIQSATLEERLRMLREEEPPRPSTRLNSSETLPAVAANRSIEPKKLAALVHGELDWIVMKALEKDRERRYESVRSLAEDVHSYLHHEPVEACPPSTLYRFRKFARRNKTLLATTVAVAIALIAGTSLATWQAILASAQRDRAVIAEEDAKQKANDLEAEAKRQSLLIEAGRIFQGVERHSQWRERVRHEVLAAIKIRADNETTTAYCQTLSGMDAKTIYKWKSPTGRAAFGRNDSFLVVASPGGGADLINLDTKETTRLSGQENSAGMGPIGFDSFGQPVQATCFSPDRFLITRLGSNQRNVSLDLPASMLTEAAKKRWKAQSKKSQSEILDRLDEIAQATPSLSHIVAWHGIPKQGRETANHGRGVVAVWNTATGKIVQSVEAGEPTLAITPDGRLFAVARGDGQIEIRTLHDETPELTLTTGHRHISALALGRDPRKGHSDAGSKRQNWLLAVADAGGTITVWDLDQGAPVSIYRGIVHHVYSLSFVPGSLALASAGHRSAQLWDTFGAGHLLSLEYSNRRKVVALSERGDRLATLGRNKDYEARIWRIEPDRGLATLRGLSAAGAHVVFSPDSRRIAAVANDWTVAVWEMNSGQMICQVQAPRGFTVDNCDVRFSAGGSSLFFSAGTKMTQWNVDSGKIENQWSLPRGLQDRIGVSESGRLLLMRYDLEDDNASATPGGMCVLREMKGNGEIDTLHQWGDLPTGINSISGTRNGRHFVLDGSRADRTRGTLVIESTTLRERSGLPWLTDAQLASVSRRDCLHHQGDDLGTQCGDCKRG